MDRDYQENSKEVIPLGGLGGLRHNTLRERIVMRLENAEKEVKNIKEILSFLDKNTEFETFHNLVGKIGY